MGVCFGREGSQYCSKRCVFFPLGVLRWVDPRPQGCHQQVQAQPRASHPPRREGSAAVRGGPSPGCVSNTGGDPQFRHRGSSSTKAVG